MTQWLIYIGIAIFSFACGLVFMAYASPYMAMNVMDALQGCW